MQNGYKYKFLKFFIIFMVVAWMAMVLIDYYRTKNDKEPLFCINNTVIREKDGNIYVCKGLGYKYYNYDKDSYTLKKFEPFWIKPTEGNNDSKNN